MPAWLAGAAHIALFTLIVPVAALASARMLERSPLPERAPLYRSLIRQQLFFLLVSLVVAHIKGLPLVKVPHDTLGAIGVAIALLLGLIGALHPLARRMLHRRRQSSLLAMPFTARERRLWVGVSIAAGVSEEISYRGVLTPLLALALGSPRLGALVSALAFGGAHAVQGVYGALVSFLVALLFQWLTAWSGSLLPAIVVHATFDVVSGFAYARWGRTAGWDRPALPDESHRERDTRQAAE